MLFNHVCLTEGWPNECNISYNTIKHVLKNKVNKGMWRENYFCCARASTTEYNKVAWGGQTSTTSYNTAENKRNVCIVQHLFSEKFDRDQTSYNKIQHDKTRYNKVAKRVQHFIKHQNCMMLYEMLYSFGGGFRGIVGKLYKNAVL